ncbi:hypothetical protein [Helicobacter sp. 23-1045]
MKKVFCIILVFVNLSNLCAESSANLGESFLDESSPFFLTTDDLLSIAELTNADLQNSAFIRTLRKENSTDEIDKAIIAISDFTSTSSYPINIEFLARATLKDILKSKTLNLTTTISGNAMSADKMLDSIRSMRNESEFGDIIPKGLLLSPKYSLSATISSETKALGAINSVEYSFIFSITNLHSGLVEWDYIERVKKSAKTPLPTLKSAESKYGKLCLQKPTEIILQMDRKKACEVAIVDIWQGSFQAIPANKATLMQQYANVACELDSAFGCRALGVVYKYGIKENLNIVAEFSGKDTGIALNEKENILLKADMKKAKNAYAKSCDLRDGGGCYNLSLLEYHSQNANLQVAGDYANKACEYGFADGCELAKEIELSKGEMLSQDALDKISQCENGIPQGCLGAGFNYHHGTNGAVKNQTKASQFYKKGCDLGLSHSCYLLGMYQVQGYGVGAKDMREAAKNTLKACEADPLKECQTIGKFDKNATQEICIRNTKLTTGSACLSAGSFFESGVGVKIDTNKALQIYKRGCDFGVENSCEAYKNLKERVR